MKRFFAFMKVAWRLCPGYIVLLVINALMSSAQVMANVILPKYLVDELIGARDINTLLILVAAIAGANLIFTFIVNLLKRGLLTKRELVNYLFERELANKIMSVEYKHLEEPQYLDLKARAQYAVTNFGAVQTYVECLSGALKATLTLLGLIAVMFSLSWVFVGLMCVTIAIMLLNQGIFSKFQVNFFQELIPVNRRYGYYVDLAYNDVNQKDIRLYDMSDMIGKTIYKYNSQINTWFKRFHMKNGIYMGIYELVVVLQTAIAYGYVGMRCVSDRFGAQIGLGSLTMYVSAAINFSSAIMELGENVITLGQTLSYLDPYMELMALPDERFTGGNKEFKGSIESVRFEHITFSYPGSDVLVLNDVSFEIHKGEKISVVGLNGAGKSTVVKLLCRLYEPNSGKIYVNGTDICEYDYDSFIRAIAVVFQDFKLFNFTIEENVTCNGACEDNGLARKVVEQVGMGEYIDKLPNGIKTLIGKAYDDEATEMSGGQSQKIAIARALYKNANLIILDEPTSALDPISEAEIYEQFNSLVGEKTAIYISHRMSSSVFCDRILVIDGGKIADFDSHANLMKKTDGLYYRLFTAQAKNYTIDD